MELDRKAFHFDLDNESVKRFYTGKRNAWSDIQDFLESHSFEKPQYSGYESAEKSRVPVASSFRFPPIRLGLKSRISSVPKSVI